MARLWITAASSLAAIALASASMVSSAGNALRNRAPAAAALLPGETQADVEVLNRLRIAGKNIPDERARATAISALKNDPLNSSALRLLMDGMQGPKDSATKIGIAQLAGRVSRRDGMIRLTLFEHAARVNQPTKALDNIDAILRVTPASQVQMFPVLKRLLANSDFRKHLGPYLKKRSLWSLDFILFAADDAQAVGHVADLVARTGKDMNPADIIVVTPPLITRAMEARQFSEIPTLLSFLAKDTDAILRGERWTTPTTDNKYGLAAWQTASNATTSVSFLNGAAGDDRKLSIYAASGAGGLAASKYLFLKPGAYQLSQRLELTDASRNGQSLQWRLKCLTETDSRVIWSSGNLLTAAQKSHKFLFDVPSECAHQILELDATVDFQATSLEVTIDKFRLARASKSSNSGNTPTSPSDESDARRSTN